MVELVGTRKVAVISWNTDVVKGTNASLEVEGEEKRMIKNDGESNLFFPADYTGTIGVIVKGSHSGEDTGSIEVT